MSELVITFKGATSDVPWYVIHAADRNEMKKALFEDFGDEVTQFLQKDDLVAAYAAADNAYSKRFHNAKAYYGQQNVQQQLGGQPVQQGAAQAQAPQQQVVQQAPPPPPPAPSNPWDAPQAPAAQGPWPPSNVVQGNFPQQPQQQAPQGPPPTWGSNSAPPSSAPHIIGEKSGQPMILKTGLKYKSGPKEGQYYDALVDPRNLPRDTPRDQKDRMRYSPDFK